MIRAIASLTLAVGILAIVSSGCSSRRADVYLDPDFDVAALSRDAIAVVGLTFLAGSDDEDTRIAFRDRASRELAQARPDLKWIEGSESWIAIGIDETYAVLDAYRLSGRLHPQQVELLRVLDDRARFIWIGRIDLDMTSLEATRHEREISDRIVVDVEPKAKREVSATFDLFDLQTSTLVFSTSLQRADVEYGYTFEVEPIEQPPSEADIIVAVRDAFEIADLPSPPARIDVVMALVREAARRLPD